MDHKQPLPENQRKLLVLGVLAGILIILFWIWTLPLNFHERGTDSRATVLFTKITDTINQARHRESTSQD